MIDFDSLASSTVFGAAPFSPGMTADALARSHGIDTASIIKLSSNENPLGPSKKAVEAMQHSAKRVAEYPDSDALITALAGSLNVASEQIFLGNGSTEVLDVIARTFINEGDKVVISEYAFAVFETVSAFAGARIIKIPAKEFAHDLPAMTQAVTTATKLMWLANPNNPTGTYATPDEVKTLLQKVPESCLVVLDEAYCDFLPESTDDSTSWLKQFPNLILVRTFSKIHALAGLRLGYALADSHIVALLNRVRQPFSINSAAQAAAVASLGDSEHVKLSREHTAQALQYLSKVCQELNLAYMPLFGNFITIDFSSFPHAYTQLLERGIMTRPLVNYGLNNHLRVSVGTEQQNKVFAEALRIVCSK